MDAELVTLWGAVDGPPVPPGGAMWWQRSPPDGWRFEKVVKRALTMKEPYSSEIRPLRRGWTIVSGYGAEDGVFMLYGVGYDRKWIANNDDEYRARRRSLNEKHLAHPSTCGVLATIRDAERERS